MQRSWTKNAFWDVNNKKWHKWCKVVSPFLYNKTNGIPMLRMDTKCPNQVCLMFELSIYRYFVLNRCWNLNSLQIKIFVYFLDMKHRWKKNTFWGVNNKKWRKWCNFFHLSYLITPMAYQCSQWTPNVQIKYYIYDWSIYGLFVLNRGWKRDTLQIMIFVYVCLTWNLDELKTRFETWITRTVINGVSLIHTSHIWLTCGHNEHQISKSGIFNIWLVDLQTLI
jgi:hypothetical protein